MTQSSGIPIIVYEESAGGAQQRPQGPQGPQGRIVDEGDKTLSTGWLPSFRGLIGRTEIVTPETLKDNFKRFIDNMSTALEGLPGTLAGFSIEELELAVEISAEGELKLLGSGAKLAGKTGITLKLARPKSA
jgi:hypothetical protein